MASMTITNARAVVDGTVKSCNLKIVDGKIKGVMPAGDTYGKTFDAKDNLVLPGFVDIHTHGWHGNDFNTLDAHGVKAARDDYAALGVTTLLPTVRADSEETMLRSILSIAKARNSLDCPQIYAIHLEGPFLALGGSMSDGYLQACSYPLFRRLQDASGGCIKLITISPELIGAPQLINKLAIEGVRVSLGHSNASYEEAVAAIDAGAISATHIFRQMAMPTQHHPAISTALLESDLYCEVICNPDVLPPALLRLLLKVKGLHRLVGVSNSMVTPLESLQNILEATQMPLPNAVAMLTENPARLLGVFHAKGSLSVGKDADLTIVDKNYQVLATYSCGELVYSR